MAWQTTLEWHQGITTQTKFLMCSIKVMLYWNRLPQALKYWLVKPHTIQHTPYNCWWNSKILFVVTMFDYRISTKQKRITNHSTWPNVKLYGVKAGNNDSIVLLTIDNSSKHHVNQWPFCTVLSSQLLLKISVAPMFCYKEIKNNCIYNTQSYKCYLTSSRLDYTVDSTRNTFK